MYNLIATWWFGFFTNFSHGNGWDNLIIYLKFNLDTILASDSRKKSYTSKLLTSLLVYDSWSSGSLLSLTVLLSLNRLSHPLQFVVAMYIFYGHTYENGTQRVLEWGSNDCCSPE